MIERSINPNEFLCVDLDQGEYVYLRSETFEGVTSDGFIPGYVHDLTVARGPGQSKSATFVTVRVELDDDHPAMAEAIREYPDLDSDNVELYDVVPVSALERPDGRPIRTYLRPVTSRERAARARSRGDYARLDLSELDRGLRTRR